MKGHFHNSSKWETAAAPIRGRNKVGESEGVAPGVNTTFFLCCPLGGHPVLSEQEEDEGHGADMRHFLPAPFALAQKGRFGSFLTKIALLNRGMIKVSPFDSE